MQAQAHVSPVTAHPWQLASGRAGLLIPRRRAVGIRQHEIGINTMLVLTAAVIIVGILCLLDMLLTFGVIRRLREHSELLRTRQFGDETPVISLSAGQVPAEFAVTADDGAA